MARKKKQTQQNSNATNSPEPEKVQEEHEDFKKEAELDKEDPNSEELGVKPSEEQKIEEPPAPTPARVSTDIASRPPSHQSSPQLLEKTIPPISATMSPLISPVPSRASTPIPVNIQNQTQDQIQAQLNQLQTAHANLLSKYQQMSRTLGDRIRGDAVKLDDQKTKLTSLESEAQNFNSQLEFERQEKEKLVSALEDLLSEREQELSMVNTQLKGEKKLATELQSRIEAQNLACSSHQKLDELQECRTELGQLRFDSLKTSNHLTQALRKLKSQSSSSSVDRRLVTNVLLQFLTADRGSANRYQILSLLASILDFSEEERQSAGLTNSSAKKKGKEKANADEDEEENGFGQMWVEFLLKESGGVKSPAAIKSPRQSGFFTPTTALSPSKPDFTPQ